MHIWPQPHLEFTEMVRRWSRPGLKQPQLTQMFQTSIIPRYPMIEARGCIHDICSCVFMFDPTQLMDWTWIVLLNHACGTVCGGPSLHPRSTYDQSSNPEDEDILTVQWPYWFCHRFDFDINDQYGLFMNSWCLWIIHETRYQRMDQLGMVKTFAACETIGSIWYKSHRSNDLYRLSIFADLFIHEFNVSVMLCLVTGTQSTLAHCLPSTGRPKAGIPPGSLLTLRLAQSAVLSSGPPCSSFVFLNMSTSGRRKWRPFGFAGRRPYVCAANRSLPYDSWVNWDELSYRYIDWCMHWTVHNLNVDSREFWYLLCSWSWVHAKDHNPDGLTLAGGHCSVCISGDWATFVKFDAMVSLCPVFPKGGSTICWSSSCHFVRSSFGEEMEWLNLRFTQTKTDRVFVATSYFACSAYKFLLLCQSLRTWYSDSMTET